MYILFVLNTIVVASTAGGVMGTTPFDQSNAMPLVLQSLISHIVPSKEVETIVVAYRRPRNSCGIDDWDFRNIEIPTMVAEVNMLWPLRETININVVGIVFVPTLNSHFDMILKPLFQAYRHMRFSKIIVLINRNATEPELKGIQTFFTICWLYKSLNVVVLFKDFQKTMMVYGYKPFPRIEVERKSLSGKGLASKHTFPDRMRDIQGHILLTLPDQVEPRCVLTFDRDGRPVMSGYVGHFIHLFAEYLNATLQFPFAMKRGQILFYGDLERMTWNNTIDLAGTLVPAINSEYAHLYSYSFEFTRICLMIPVAENKPINVLFFYLMSYPMCVIGLTYIIVFTAILNLKRFYITQRRRIGRNKDVWSLLPDLILNDVALRGILGQSFVMQRNAGFNNKFTYILISLTGLYFNLLYQAYLQTFLTQPLKERQPKTFGDLVAKQIYTIMSENEILYFDKKRYTDVRPLYLAVSYEEFRLLRNNFNTSYAYPANNMVWETFYRNQQRFFSTNLFIYSDDACFKGSNLLSFAVSENSIYHAALNRLILLVRAHGLIDHWFRTNFIDMVAAGRTSFRDLSEKPHYGGPLQLVDLNWIVVLYALMTMASVGIFLVEFFWSRMMQQKFK